MVELAAGTFMSVEARPVFEAVFGRLSRAFTKRQMKKEGGKR